MSRLRFVRLCTPLLPLLAHIPLGAHPHQSHGALPPVQASHTAGACQAVDDSTRKDTLFRRVNLSPKQGPLLAQLARISQEARQRNLTPILDIGAWWCGPCQELDTKFASPEVLPATRQMYVVHLEVDLWGPTLDSLQVDHRYIPQLVAIDATARPTAPWRPHASNGWTPELIASLREYFVTAHTRFTSASSDSTATPKTP